MLVARHFCGVRPIAYAVTFDSQNGIYPRRMSSDQNEASCAGERVIVEAHVHGGETQTRIALLSRVRFADEASMSTDSL
jgi:hypothetical protein